MKCGDWINQQVDFRLSGIEKSINYFDLFKIKGHRSCGTIAAFNSSKGFYKLNSFDRFIKCNNNSGLFEAVDLSRMRGVRIRNARFSSLTKELGFDGPFITNFADAQGWTYEEIFGCDYSFPIIQFSRTVEQRGKVALFPLGYFYMGPGSKNLPIIKDEISFEDKKNMLVWRGRLTGTKIIEGKFLWAKSFYSNNSNNQEKNISQYLDFPRINIPLLLSSAPWADVSLVASDDELKSLDTYSFSEIGLKKIFAQPLPIKSQLENKFILAVPGNCYPSSLYWSLCSNSVVFLVENQWETIFDSGLKPWVHYVPVKSDGSDIAEKFDRMLSDPIMCEEISRNAKIYMQPFLDSKLRDAADWLTLSKLQESILDSDFIEKFSSFSRG